ncbi:SIR2 family protein [Aeromonas veronii]|uniref:SIR2 family protein n=1 Tax=Aeromonas veronii TaxID=654 RepID=UPI000280549C|nr:SIR2 family protein [Aeromonas veronii]EKB15469.1 hypothetical protein HMPREF1169_00776 [Aeromonas veronii AER397]
MERQFFAEKMLLNRIKINQNDVSFIFGSALSAIKDGAGIPNVAQVSEIIRSYIEELDLLDEYDEFINDAEEQNIYQESFAFITVLKGAAAAQEIVKRVVMTNYDHNTGKHRIPKAIKDFVSCIKEGKLKVKNIITTNFDTLLEEQFKNEGIQFNSISIVSDSNIIENSNGFINIIHIHGVWNKGDTMHTRNQLEAKRDKIEASLRNVLTEQNVIIMAYSGWTDSFTRTLTNIVNDDKANYNLAWCFYEKEEGVIDRNFQSLFSSLSPAITRERIQFFNNIDCNRVFEELLIESKAKKKQINNQ